MYIQCHTQTLVPLNQYSCPNVEIKIFATMFLKKAATQGSPF